MQKLVAITLTMNPVYGRGISDKKQYQLFDSLLNRIFKLKRCSFIAEYTKNNDIHVHGVIESKGRSMRSIIISLNNTLRCQPMIGYRNIKEIELLSGWITYLSEDLHLTEDLLGQSPIIRDDLKYFSAHYEEYLEERYRQEKIEQEKFLSDVPYPPKVDLVDTFLSFDA